MKLAIVTFVGATALLSQQQSSLLAYAAEESLSRGNQRRGLKGRIPTAKSVKDPAELGIDYNEKLEKLESKCTALKEKISNLVVLDETTAAQAVTAQAGLVNGVTFPSTSTSAEVRADAADAYLYQCKLLKDEVDEYKKVVKAAGYIQGKIDAYTSQLNDLVDNDLAKLDLEYVDAPGKDSASACTPIV